ncbi:MAG: hypothetical protein HY744_05900 [Deltaproteobacteria bacterium]|nr:hypothetical protein [Deltaproteobacteria bacterium]
MTRARSLSPAVLCRRWLRSHEEGSPDELVFRPAGYAFPPSRGRSGFELRPDGALVRIAIGPADGPRESAGRWRLEDDELVIEPAGSAEPPSRRRVLSATAERLVVRR